MKLFRTVIAALLLLCSTVATAHDFTVGGIYYNILSSTDQTVEVTYKGTPSENSNTYTGSVTIPESVTINGTTYSVTTIGDYGFCNCESLTNVRIPISVTKIGKSAFYNCSSLTSITIPYSVTTIGNGAFSGCNNLASISVIEGNTTYDSRSGCNAIIETATNTLHTGCKNTIIPNGITTIGEEAFHGCRALTDISIPKSVTMIGNYAFCECESLTSIRIPSNVTKIGGLAFCDCTGLTSIISHIPAAKLFTPGNAAFIGIDKSNCTLYVPSGAKNAYASTSEWKEFTNIAEMARNFDGQCGNNVYWTFEEETSTLTIFGEGAMYDYITYETPWEKLRWSIYNLVIEKGITTIGNNAFFGLAKIESVRIPGSVTAIGEKAFAGCNATTIEIPSSVTTIGDYAFSECTRLGDVTIPGNVTTIGDYAFSSCYNLDDVTIHNGVKSIGYAAFYECESLTNIEIPSSVTTIGDYAFNYCTSLARVRINDGVESIGNYTFMYCENLTSIEIPNSATTIGKYAFYGCYSLESVTIPGSVTTIGDRAFSSCNSLTRITSHIPAKKLFATNGYESGIDKNTCTLYVPFGAKEKYASTSGWRDFKNIVELPRGSFDLTVSAAKYATLYLDFDAVIPNGVEVYTASTVDGDRLMMQEVTGILPANTGVIVRAEQGTYTFGESTETVDAIEGNLFSGSVEDEYITPIFGIRYYVLAMKDGVVGMYADALTGGKFKNNAHKAYLKLEKKGFGIYDEEVNTEDPGMQLSNSYYFDFGGTTAIDPVVTECEDNIYYDLSGRRVENPTRGIYIVNGKKRLVK